MEFFDLLVGGFLKFCKNLNSFDGNFIGGKGLVFVRV